MALFTFNWTQMADGEQRSGRVGIHRHAQAERAGRAGERQRLHRIVAIDEEVRVVGAEVDPARIDQVAVPAGQVRPN